MSYLIRIILPNFVMHSYAVLNTITMRSYCISLGAASLVMTGSIGASAQSVSTVSPISPDSAAAQAVQSVRAASEPWNVYCEIYQSGLRHMGVNFGSNSNNSDWPWANDLVDARTGRRLQFNNIIDGLNYMGRRGWKLVQNYTTLDANGLGKPDSDVHWVLTKQVRSEADIMDGLTTKKAYSEHRAG